MRFSGYVAANIFGSVLSYSSDLSLKERLSGCPAPPLAFIVTVTIASAVARAERIVFYQTACASVVAVAVVGSVAGERVARLVDLALMAARVDGHMLV